jgi:tetratricopeptide (TPR) repeat protein
VLYVLLWILVPTPLWAQDRKLHGEVIHIGGNGEKLPEANVTVIIKQTGDRDTTDSRGRFEVFLHKAFKVGEKVTLDIEKPDWRIQYPLDGETRLPDDLQKTLVEVRLLPVGSKLFWTHDRIEKFIQDTAEQSKQQVKPEGKPEEIDFSRYIKDWAAKYGFNAQQAREEIDKWIADIEKNQNDLYKLGLAAFAKKNFDEASVLFNESAELKAKKLETVKQQEKTLTEEVVRDFRLTGDAHYNNYTFDQALQAYQHALRYITKDQTPQLWAAIMLDIGKAHLQIGGQTAGLDIHTHLTAAVQAYNQALEVHTRETLPQQWAATQNNLGLAWGEQGIRTGGARGTQLLAEAVTAYRQALEVYAHEALPQDWATTQNNLGNALSDQGTRTGGARGMQLLAEAVTAYRQALEVYTRETLPQRWALTQNNLGIALKEQGIRTEGERGMQLLAEAVTTYRQALEVRTRETLPQDWAATQSNLGTALSDQGTRIGGEHGTQLLAEAVTAYRQALEVYTRETFPQRWALTQNNLGIALKEQGIRTEGERGMQLLAEAVTTYRQALEVYTRETLPQQWAMTQNNLALTLSDQGIRTAGERGMQLLAEAVAAYRQALEIYTYETMPPQWAQIHNNLAKVYIALKDWPNAAASYANVLKVAPAEEAYRTASHLYHEVLFQFPEAFALNQHWLEQHHDDLSALSNLVEKHFTTGRFVQCAQRIGTIMEHPALKSSTKIALRAIEIANLLALNNSSQVPDKLQTLIDNLASQPEDFKVTWTFNGTKHFIDHSAQLAPYRTWLGQLFTALQAEDRQTALTGLQAARSGLLAVAK